MTEQTALVGLFYPTTDNVLISRCHNPDVLLCVSMLAVLNMGHAVWL